MRNLQLNFVLDTNERTSSPSGNITLNVSDVDTNEVLGVQVVPCRLDHLRIAVKAFYDELGDMVVPANASGELYDYEYIHATMSKQLEDIRAEEAVTALTLQQEKDMKTAKRVLDMLNTQSFHNFYTGAHEDYITGDSEMTAEEMQQLVIDKFIRKF